MLADKGFDGDANHKMEQGAGRAELPGMETRSAGDSLREVKAHDGRP
jgi:hypothetical protein